MSRSRHNADHWNNTDAHKARRTVRKFKRGMADLWSPEIWRDVYVDAAGILREVGEHVNRGRVRPLGKGGAR